MTPGTPNPGFGAVSLAQVSPGCCTLLKTKQEHCLNCRHLRPHSELLEHKTSLKMVSELSVALSAASHSPSAAAMRLC